jgi:hypothetical protein
MVWDVDQSPRNPYPNVRPRGLQFPVDINRLVEAVVVSPHAEADVFDQVQDLLATHSYDIPLSKSGFTGYGHLLPTAEEISQYGKA